MPCVNKSLKTVRIASPIGDIFLKSCEEGVHEISLSPDIKDENFQPLTVSQDVNKGLIDGAEAPSEVCSRWLIQYFEDPFKMDGFKIPKICPLGDNGFRPSVWDKLLNTVKVGETVTYQELANRLNNPGAARAVGSAMKNNPVSILVPCHRVVRKNGLGLYSGGTRQKVKAWLLRHEGVDLSRLGD
ncbi:UNVERIFIED_CONTAM: hypothetical protein RMT77_008475 [Armadillidium vulgare]